MACPDCGSSFGEYRISSSVETHGLDCGPYERFEQEYIVCRECGEGSISRSGRARRNCQLKFQIHPWLTNAGLDQIEALIPRRNASSLHQFSPHIQGTAKLHSASA